MGAFAVFPLLTAVPLLVAGVAKFRDVADTRETLRRFGFPGVVVPVAAVLVPVAEVVVALVLLLGGPPIFVVGGVGAVVLTGGFCFVVVRALLRGDDFDCGCFGRWGRTRITPLLAVRNAALLLIAVATVVVGVGGFPGVPVVVSGVTASGALWALALLAGMVLTALFMAAATSSPRTEPAGPTPAQGNAADSEVVTADGRVVRVRDLAVRRPHVLVFVQPGCASCETILDQLATSLLDDSDVRIAVSGARAVFEAARPELAPLALYAVQSTRAALGIHRTPAAVTVGLNGVLGAPVAGAAAVTRLLADHATFAQSGSGGRAVP
ncbi:MauE/DoxX family redox-associated membrane protein [Herbiconiux ginsengi]|uniref:Methylamine utilisation protein MauE n=1 Tax=Herbiconiux ginsengi TaxID=381665 RepID=A0A1H3SNN2_9MICO|nr:MauE/DoxX family redox-associated membrane protein [Herbiconiux ginsengi]SDZ39602.1 Methylamine utilisation protein MauE [Herbiconiux ginsengi]